MVASTNSAVSTELGNPTIEYLQDGRHGARFFGWLFVWFSRFRGRGHAGQARLHYPIINSYVSWDQRMGEVPITGIEVTVASELMVTPTEDAKKSSDLIPFIYRTATGMLWQEAI